MDARPRPYPLSLLEATFLQYLAPKIVVVGDDKQVSPRAVGVDHAELQGLANRFLFDDRYRASWEDPKRSLFDEARMRFGDLVTLVEHRRCVPDIIGFSNRIAYEPDGIRLISVRQTGSDALEPVVPVLVPDGFLRGEVNRVNPPEVDAVVVQVEVCIADARYDDLSFGVVSLTGPHQAKLIEKELMDRVDPREWEARDLRCGTSPDFQGSERDVMFLSMVAVLDEGRRYAPLTGEMYVQQFNVAASRAKDQMWVFHSVRPEELTNHDDMRYQLLDYCYGVSRRRLESGDGRSTSPVPEDHLVSPFDSLFEQRVHNRIFDRGHTVIPQYEVGPRRIDLVIVGAHGRLAVECDGDHWHGPDRYGHDLARRRELQRCGWQFFNVRESEFNIDASRALAPLRALLEDLEICPHGALAPERPDVTTESPTPPSVVDDPLDESAGIPIAPAVPSPSSFEEVARLAEDPPATPGSKEDENEPPEPIQLDLEQEGSPSGAEPMEDPASQAVGESPSKGALPSYSSWSTGDRLPDPLTASPSELAQGLRQIVEVEGPVLGDRLYQLYVTSAGGSRVGAKIKRVLNRASSASERRGDLVADNPLAEAGQIVKTFRLPNQPEVEMRELGPRTIHHVPPAELGAVLEMVREPADDEETWFRRVLKLYGLSRLAWPTRRRLEACTALVRRTDG